MSDQPAPNAPPPAPAPAPAPPGEVPINPNPTQTPTPLGPQTPDKAPGTERREAIQRAFDRARDGDTKPAPKAAKPALGHNNPPEETKPERAQPAREIHREGGKFARAPESQPRSSESGREVPSAKAAGEKPEWTRMPETAPYREPHPRMAEHAQRDWHAAPESVRGEFHRLAKETNDIHKAYRADYDKMNSIRHFDDLATQHGTTLDRALTNYVSMEQKLRTDPVGGIDVIVNNLGLKAPDGSPIGLRDIAYHVLSQSPEQLKMMQQGNAQQAATNQIGALHQEIAGLKEAVVQMHTQQRFTHTRSAVDQFADAHPRFDELGDLIEQELQFGYDLTTAYQRAELLRPAHPTHAAQTRNPPAQTRQDRSISGAPDSGPSNGSDRGKPGKPVGRREAIQNAIRRVNGGFA